MNTKAGLLVGSSLLLAACASAPPPSGPAANAVMRPATGSQVHGNVTFTEVGNVIRVNAEIAALSSGLNTLRIHEKGDCSKPDASSAGVLEREIGPLPQDEYGKAVSTYTISGATARSVFDSPKAQFSLTSMSGVTAYCNSPMVESRVSTPSSESARRHRGDKRVM